MSKMLRALALLALVTLLNAQAPAEAQSEAVPGAIDRLQLSLLQWYVRFLNTRLLTRTRDHRSRCRSL